MASVSINDDPEKKPLLSADVEDNDAAVQKAKIVHRARVLQAALVFVQVALWTVLGATGQVVVHKGSYDPHGTCLDVLAAFTLLELFVTYSVVWSSEAIINLGQYVAPLFFVLITTKMWMFGDWTERKAEASIVCMSFTASILHTVLFRIAARTVSNEVTALRWSACKKILRPYFIPRGIRNKIFVVLTWVVLISGKICGIYSPIVLGQIVNKLTQRPPQESKDLIALYVSLNLAPTLLREVQDNLYVKVWQCAYAEVAETTFRHVHSLSLEWHLKKKMGNIVRAMDRGMNGADNLMYYSMIYLFPAIGTAIAAFVVFAVHFKQPIIAGVCFLAFGFYCWITFVVTIWRRKFREQMNKHDNEMHDKASDSLVNFETVKCFANEEHEVQHYINSVKQYQQGSFNTQWSTSVINISQNSTIQAAMLGSLLVAAYCIVNHEDGFDAGKFVAVQAYVLTIFSPLSYLGMIYNMIINSMVDIQNLSDLLSATPDIVDAEDAKDLTALVDAKKGVSIEFKDVDFRYPTAGPTQGLKKVSFTIPAGTTTAIVGPTGSGKTTISRLLFRFYDVQGGQVLINGHDVRNCAQQSVRSLIGVVPQDTVMFNESVKYNIRYGKLSASDEEVQEASKKAQVHDFVMSFEKQYDTMCGERGLKLSGGEKQRIAVARCLLKDPPVVLLDEATSALDNKTEREVQKALACLEGRTTLMIAHRLTTVLRADQIVVLKNGEVAEIGNHHQLLAANGLYSGMWNAQLMDDASDYSI